MITGQIGMTGAPVAMVRYVVATMAAGTHARTRTAVWTLAFRPFFIAAGLWAALALALWIALLFSGHPLPSRFDPLSWHIHEMLFGFVPAAIGGFMLTAIPNWTGRRPIQGVALGALALLWLLGRVVCLVSALLPLWPAAAIDLAFPFVLCALAAREIIAARNWRNLAMPLPIGVLGVADLLMYLQLGGESVAPGLGWRLGLAAVIMLISAVGGRIIPNFTRNWLVKRSAHRPGAALTAAAALPAPAGLPDRAALGSLHAGLIAWAFLPEQPLVGALLLLAAALNLWRLLRWRGQATLAEPLLTILHVGYGWVAVGAGLLGAATLTGGVPLPAAIHALTAGAIGTMTLAVMTRVTLGHTGRPLHADMCTVLIYLLVTLAAALRVAAGFDNGAFLLLIDLSATAWVAAFLLFAVRYGPILMAPRTSQAAG
ncbi:MAG: NnrS family protein [Steroidobacteraceae bacterium]